MNCESANKYLPLLTGGELSPKEVEALRSHLKECPECFSEYEELKEAGEFIRRMAGKDRPDPLPENFAALVQQRMIENGQKKQGRLKKLAWSFGFATCGLLLIIALLLKFPGPTLVTAEQLLNELQEFPDIKESTLEWDTSDRLLQAFGSPIKVTSWDTHKESGIYIILHKPDPEKRPDVYHIVYCGKGKDLSAFKAYPWLHQRKNRLLSKTGSLENTYVVVFLMPDSTPRERRQIEKALIQKFRPYFNKGV